MTKFELIKAKNILSNAIILANKYKKLTGKPMGITGEVAEVTAASLLGLELTGARHPGYDAIWKKGGRRKFVQIKGRCIPKGAKSGQRVGNIRLNHLWDSVLLVILDGDLRCDLIYEVERSAIQKAIKTPGSKARSRGALGVNFFRRKGRQVWPSAK